MNDEANNNQPAERTILIAEDDFNSMELLKRALKNTGIKLLAVRNGREAVEAVEKNPEISIVLMDIKMPVMDGLKAAKLIKSIRSDVVIIAQTAHVFSEDREKAYEAGCDDFLTKPIIIEELMLKIKKYA